MTPASIELAALPKDCQERPGLAAALASALVSALREWIEADAGQTPPAPFLSRAETIAGACVTAGLEVAAGLTSPEFKLTLAAVTLLNEPGGVAAAHAFLDRVAANIDAASRRNQA